ncbi:hypothetical protein HCN51_28425 [Nonomuraea sp. FMUSA5-5]|uniref:DUF2207 domain-containing protein n=1 Tax=Nonomuraea composti TaxID=2720023 RepID=A0ABX1B688_9ACTN|nr:hypothetical protein [Nonomuraea sp. FMUSA5-5]NJP93325.1 hypothetical protein [Nonomuraea sp. FMUSA5-5]
MDLVWPAAAWALWVATLAAAFKVSSRHPPGPAPEGPAPAPVADLLRGTRAQEVFHSALFELAERGWVAIEGDHLSLRPPPREPLPAYERWAMEQVRARLGDAPEVAVIDLMPPAPELDRAFVPLVRRHAIDLGLARRRWPSLLVPVLLAAGLAVPWWVTVAASGVSWPGIIATAVSFVAGVGLLMGGRGFVLTARGREVAEAGPAGSEQEWIFTGSGWSSGEIVPARPLPRRQEITGHVVKRWADTGRYYIALHDGSSAKATAFEVEEGLYQDVLPGDSVRVLVRPGSGTVVRMLAHDRHW